MRFTIFSAAIAFVTVLAPSSAFGIEDEPPCSQGQFSFDDGFADNVPFGAIAWWRLNEDTGTTAEDEIGDNDGTYAGSFLLDAQGAFTSQPGGAVDLSPDRTGRVETPLQAFEKGQGWSYAGFACRVAPDRFDSLFGGSPRGRVAGLYTSSADPDRVFFDPRLEGGTSAVSWDGALPPDGTWFYWRLEFDEPADQAELFIDTGPILQDFISMGTRVVTEPLPTLPGTFWIGNYPTNQAWNGPIDSVAVWDFVASGPNP